MANTDWLSPFLTKASPYLSKASGWFNEVASLADLAQGATVNLAVTGLSRSGKTVFITSLIHNLLSAAHSPNRMPLFSVVANGRLLGTHLRGGGAGRLPRFRYQENIDAMAAGAPLWPAGTDDLREIGLDIHFVPATAAGRLFGEITGNPATVSVRIVDYPGEWLLDLPMMMQSYAEWSRAALALYRRGVRAEAARAFLGFIADNPYHALASEQVAKQAHDLYRAFLVKARDVHGLSYLQPGRFLCPGNLADAPFLWFAPLDLPEHAVIEPTSLAGLMEQRYETYRREVVTRFYQDHFRKFSRQIVLVDVLRALLAGREAFEDQRLALEALMQSFRYGSGSIFSKLLWGPHIDRVLFAATKADHVPDIQRDHLAELLRHMTAVPGIDARNASARIDVMALASVISTVEETGDIDGRRVQFVIGRPLGQQKQQKFFAGTVPIRPPRAETWDAPFLNVPVFEPPAIDPSPVEGIPHINLDLACEFLLGDRLR